MASLFLVIQLSTSVILLLVIPYAIYCNTKIFKFNGEMFIQKRSTSLIYGFNISCITNMFTTIFVSLIRLVHHHSYYTTLHYIGFITWFLSLWSIIFFLISKTWMIYFKYYWTHYTIESEWIQIINKNALTSTTNSQQNWFIKNNRKYGNLHYVYKYVCLFCTIGVLINLCAVIIFVKNDLASGVHTHDMTAGFLVLALLFVSLNPPIMFYAYIAWKTPACDDIFYIHWEAKMHAKLLLLLGFFFLLSTVWFIVSGDWTSVTLGMLTMDLILFAMIYVSTCMIATKNQWKHDSSQRKKVELEEILTNEDAIHSFMIHLSREYSMECLLSYIEIVQFQQYIKEFMVSNNESISNHRLIDFPSNIVTSEIVESPCKDEPHPDDMDFIQNAKIKAHQLYTKYVAFGSEFEINISAPQRGNLEDLLCDVIGLEKYNIGSCELFGIFEEIKKEMFYLLSLSLNRFRHDASFGDEYTHVVSICSNNSLRSVYR
eukprot:140320_1